jgi:hypothetical protein
MNKGDTIVCIDNNGNNFFTNGNKYTVIEYYPSKANHKDALKTDFIR